MSKGGIYKRIRVAVSPLSNTIYAGTILKDGKTWSSGRQDVTVDALVAVAEHCIAFGKPVEIRLADGTLEYTITAAKTPGATTAAREHGAKS